MGCPGCFQQTKVRATLSPSPNPLHSYTASEKGWNNMSAKYLLYIDMLGFSDLVRKRGAAKMLYETINKLNVHRHDAFKTIAFSDTLLVCNINNPKTKHDREYLVMYSCEFAKDLFYRLIGRDLHFRGYLTLGEFRIDDFENLEAFYGEALIDAH
jgi:hypothetical protein